jgi:hypothetical protein
MSTIREHLGDMHKSFAAHHKQLSKNYRAAAGSLKGMAKAARKSDMKDDNTDDDDQQTISSTVADFLLEQADLHDAMCAEESQRCAECMKAQREDDLAKGDPALRSVSAINWGVQMVPRAGSPGSEGFRKQALPDVAEELKKVFGVDEEVHHEI